MGEKKLKELPGELTIRDAYGPAMKITEQKEADGYFELLVQHSMKHEHLSREKAEEINRANLGYYTGYYDRETRERVERLFRCTHPIFGPVPRGAPTAKESFVEGHKQGTP